MYHARSRILLLSLIALSVPCASLAQETLSTEASTIMKSRKTEIYVGGYLLGAIPQDKNLSVGQNTIPNTDVRGSIGAGIKFGVFPSFAGKVLGFETELFGTGGSVKAPRVSTGTGTAQADANLVTINNMFNLLLRYPSDTIQPYIGVGGGWSAGVLKDVNIQSGNVGLTGSSGDMTAAYQFLGGVRTFISKKLFLFAEYKYFVARHTWRTEGSGNPNVQLVFQTHIVSGGLGWSF